MTQEKPATKQKINKKNLVKNWLLMGRTLTARKCSNIFGADRLADIVFKLRNEGMRIESPLTKGIDRYGNKVEYSVYKWLGEIPRIRFDHISRHDKKTKVYNFTHRYPMLLPEMKKHIKKYLEKKCRVKVKRLLQLRNRPHILAETVVDDRIFVIYYEP